jgi:putative redox protein
MVEIDVTYIGDKKCVALHEEGAELMTDAPKDIGGNASAFSPTDLVAAGLAACIVTTMGMYAERHNYELKGVKAHVIKEMNPSPRRIGRLPVVVTMPASVPMELRAGLERVGHLCPVHASLHPDIDSPIEYRYE